MEGGKYLKLTLTKVYIKWRLGEELTESEKCELIDICDFDLIEEEDQIKPFRLVDRQGANFGGIESERFKRLDQVLNRIGRYLWDIFVRGGEVTEGEIQEKRRDRSGN